MHNTAEVTGFSWKRQEFDHDWDNEAEAPVAELEFTEADTEASRALKLQVVRAYNRRLDERERRRRVILEASGGGGIAG